MTRSRAWTSSATDVGRRRCRRGRAIAAGVAALVSACIAPDGHAQSTNPPYVDLFNPLITRNPTLDRELDLIGRHEHDVDGRSTELSLSLTWSFSRLELSFEMPLVISDPRDGPMQTGAGDLHLEGFVQLWQAATVPAVGGVGVGLTLPSGSQRRGLGGETSVTPYVAIGGAVPRVVDVLGELNYTWTSGGPAAGAQRLAANLAVALTVGRIVQPFVEINLVVPTRRSDDGSAADSLGAQLYFTPGLYLRFGDWTTLSTGVQMPVTRSRTFDYQVVSVFTRSF